MTRLYFKCLILSAKYGNMDSKGMQSLRSICG